MLKSSSLSREKRIFFVVALVAAFGMAAIISDSTLARDNTYKFGTFEDIDVDRSGFLENGEYLDYAFGRADWDNDGYLEETEWAKYTETYYDPYELEYESYTYYDTDGDGFIDRSEFNEVPTTDLYDAWDYDEDELIDADDWDEVTVYYYDAE